MISEAKLGAFVDAAALDVDSALAVALERAAEAGVKGKVKLTLLAAEREGTDVRAWHVDLQRKARRQVRGAKAPKADVELIMTEATWGEIALGRLAPLEAFGAGRLRIRGDAGIAEALHEQLKSDADDLV